MDAADSPFPHLDVEIDEDNEENAGNNRAVGPHAFGHHEQGIEGAVHEHGHQEGQQAVFAPVLGVELGQSKVVAHHDAEEEMARDGEDSTDRAGVHGPKEAILGEDVSEILKAGKAQGYETGVDNAVEILVELAAAPDSPSEHEQFAQLLAAACHHKARIDPADNGNAGVVLAQQRLQQSRRKDGQGAKEETLD